MPPSRLPIPPLFRLYQKLTLAVAFSLFLIPSPLQELKADELFLSSRISELKQQILGIQNQLQQLPPKELKSMNGYLGYHSAITPADPTGKPLNKSITFILQKDTAKRIRTIAIMPASNPRYSPDVAYGFPKRFRVEILGDPEEKPLRTYDYSQQDYAETQLIPLLISNIDTTAQAVRIVVDRGVEKDGWEYFALGEVYIFSDGDFNTTVNIAPYSKVFTSDSFESRATWSPYYLYDRMTPYNMSLGPKTKANTDYVAVIPLQEEIEPQIQVTIDLHEPTPIGRIEFFPARPPWEISLPHFGYPGSIVVEAFEDSDFSAEPAIYKEIINSWDETRSIVLGDIFFSVPLFSPGARYVRVTFGELPVHGPSRIFAMGEIAILRSGLNVSKNKSVSVSGITQQGLDPSLLVDNYASNREILHPEVWLHGLVERHQLEKRLRQSEAALHEATFTRERRINSSLILVLLFAVTWALVLYVRSRLSRSRELVQIRNQISSDLHDDVGSSIGAFSLGMERLRNHSHSPAVDKVTQDLRLLAKEAAVALREAVWLTKQDSISLKDLGSMIKERAFFILGKDRVICQMEESLPDLIVSIVHKRNIMLLFKEALHNFVKHAQASHLEITFRRGRNNTLLLQLEDDGVGISEQDPNHKGWGLSTMRTRAKLMGGDLQISSQSGKGTRLELRIPISNLRKK